MARAVGLGPRGTPSLARMLLTRSRIVEGLTTSCWAMAALLRPLASRRQHVALALGEIETGGGGMGQGA